MKTSGLLLPNDGPYLNLRGILVALRERDSNEGVS